MYLHCIEIAPRNVLVMQEIMTVNTPGLCYCQTFKSHLIGLSGFWLTVYGYCKRIELLTSFPGVGFKVERDGLVAVSEQFRAISEQFQSNFRAISEQFQCSFSGISEQLLFFLWHLRAVSEQFQSNLNFDIISEQFQSSFRAVSW